MASGRYCQPIDDCGELQAAPGDLFVHYVRGCYAPDGSADDATAAPTAAETANSTSAENDAVILSCDFDDGALCGNWSNVGPNDWRVRNRQPTSKFTGPCKMGDEATCRGGTNFFAHVESSGTNNHTFVLASPSFDALDEAARLTFDYHCAGITCGTFAVDYWLKDRQWTTAWTVFGLAPAPDETCFRSVDRARS